MDVRLDLMTGDAVFANGPAVIGDGVISDAASNVAQRLYIMLRTFAGEWYLNVEHGVPYFQSVLGKKVPVETIDLIFQQRILEEEGVQEIVEFSSSLSTSRVYSMRFKVKANGLTVDIANIEAGV